MQTNFKELLDNTNLKPSEILEYYAKEIDRCFKQFNVNYDLYILTYFDYTKGFYHNTLKETAVEEFLFYDSLVNMSRNMGNLIKEFLSLYNVIEDRYQITIYNLDKDKNISFRDLIRFIDLNVYNIGNLSNHYNKVHTDIKTLICYVKTQEEIVKVIEIKENNKEDEIAMLEFYVSNLEAKQIQDTKDINDLVSENNELRRVLALNSGGVEDCGYN